MREVINQILWIEPFRTYFLLVVLILGGLLFIYYIVKGLIRLFKK